MMDFPSKQCNGQAHLTDGNNYSRPFRRVDYHSRWLQYIRVAMLIIQATYIQCHYAIFKVLNQIQILCINIQFIRALVMLKIAFIIHKNNFIYYRKIIAFEELSKQPYCDVKDT